MITIARPAADPATEIRITKLHATRGMNFWSRRAVIRMDLAVGAYEDISSAEVAGFTAALVHALPGLIEHQCSIGARGGFVTRLRRGTYAPHIIEHVALELQSMVGHDVGYGRTRGGDVPGEYTVVFEQQHEQVGLRAAALALGTVQRAFAGTLETVESYVHELEALSKTPDSSPIVQHVACGITGGTGRAEAQQELVRRLAARAAPDRLVIDASPAFILQAGLPYARSDLAIVLDEAPRDVPERYQEEEHARRLLGTVADAVPRNGIVICPAKAWELQDYIRDQRRRVAIFAPDDNITRRDEKVATATGRVVDGMILVARCDEPVPAGPVDPALPAGPQVAAALADYLLATRED